MSASGILENSKAALRVAAFFWNPDGLKKAASFSLAAFVEVYFTRKSYEQLS
jgi:hypothetical protein